MYKRLCASCASFFLLCTFNQHLLAVQVLFILHMPAAIVHDTFLLMSVCDFFLSVWPCWLLSVFNHSDSADSDSYCFRGITFIVFVT